MDASIVAYDLLQQEAREQRGIVDTRLSAPDAHDASHRPSTSMGPPPLPLKCLDPWKRILENIAAPIPTPDPFGADQMFSELPGPAGRHGVNQEFSAGPIGHPLPLLRDLPPSPSVVETERGARDQPIEIDSNGGDDSDHEVSDHEPESSFGGYVTEEEEDGESESHMYRWQASRIEGSKLRKAARKAKSADSSDAGRREKVGVKSKSTKETVPPCADAQPETSSNGVEDPADIAGEFDLQSYNIHPLKSVTIKVQGRQVCADARGLLCSLHMKEVTETEAGVAKFKEEINATTEMAIRQEDSAKAFHMVKESASERDPALRDSRISKIYACIYVDCSESPVLPECPSEEARLVWRRLERESLGEYQGAEGYPLYDISNDISSDEDDITVAKQPKDKVELALSRPIGTYDFLNPPKDLSAFTQQSTNDQQLATIRSFQTPRGKTPRGSIKNVVRGTVLEPPNIAGPPPVHASSAAMSRQDSGPTQNTGQTSGPFRRQSQRATQAGSLLADDFHDHGNRMRATILGPEGPFALNIGTEQHEQLFRGYESRDAHLHEAGLRSTEDRPSKQPRKR